MCILGYFPEFMFSLKLIPPPARTFIKVVVRGIISRVPVPLNKIPVTPSDHTHVGRNGQEPFDLGGPSSVIVSTGGQIDVEESKRQGCEAIASAAVKSNALGVATEGVVYRVRSGFVIVQKGGVDHDQSPALIIGRVIIKEAPTWVGAFESVVAAQEVKSGLLNQDTVGVRG